MPASGGGRERREAQSVEEDREDIGGSPMEEGSARSEFGEKQTKETTDSSQQ